jgi:NADH-quinone oxidoreductase subunit F
VPVPIQGALKYFRDEIVQHQKEGGCPFDPAASTLWAGSSGGRGGSSPRSDGAGLK